MANPYAVVTLLEAGGYCGFTWDFISKIWSVDHIIIVMLIIECAIRGSAEKWQIHTQWWHFCRLGVTVDIWWYFIRKIWSVDHIIIVMFIIECAIRGSKEKWQIHTQWWHFCRLVVTVHFDDISLEKYGQLIIKSLSCSSLSVLLGGLQKSGKSIRNGDTFVG